MVSTELRIEQFELRQLANLLRLMDPPDAAAEDGGRQTLRGEALRWLDRLTEAKADTASRDKTYGPPALVLFRAGRPVRGLRLGGEPLALDGLNSAARDELRAFRQRCRCSVLVAIHSEMLPELLGQVQASVRPGDDLVAQALCAARVLRSRGKTALMIEPELVTRLPLPSYELLQTTFAHMLPHGHTLVFYLLNRSEIWTSLIVRQRAGDIDLITSHRGLGGEARLRSLRDVPQLLQLVKRRFGPPHVGAFVGLRTWGRFVRGDRAAIGRALAAGEAILDPCPSWLLAIVGAGAVSEAAARSARLAGKLLQRTPVGGRLFGGGAERLASRLANPLESLGLDPWELITWGREWTRRFAPLVEQSATASWRAAAWPARSRPDP